MSFEASLLRILVNEVAHSTFNYSVDKGQYAHICMHHKIRITK